MIVGAICGSHIANVIVGGSDFNPAGLLGMGIGAFVGSFIASYVIERYKLYRDEAKEYSSARNRDEAKEYSSARKRDVAEVDSSTRKRDEAEDGSSTWKSFLQVIIWGIFILHLFLEKVQDIEDGLLNRSVWSYVFSGGKTPIATKEEKKNYDSNRQSDSGDYLINQVMPSTINMIDPVEAMWDGVSLENAMDAHRNDTYNALRDDIQQRDLYNEARRLLRQTQDAATPDVQTTPIINGAPYNKNTNPVKENSDLIDLSDYL